MMLALLAGGLIAAAPALAASTFKFASDWTVNNNADWTPFPPDPAPLGASNGFCTNASTPTGSWAEFSFDAFGIPASDVIQGIEVTLLYHGPTGPGNDLDLKKSGTVVGSKTIAPGGVTPSTCANTSLETAGSPTDDWGSGLTPADFNTAGTVTVRFNQVSNEVQIDSVKLTVHHGPANTAPTADAGGPYSVPEGGSGPLDGSGSSDPEGDALTYAWDLDNDGMYDDATGVNPSFSAAGRDGPDTQTVGLLVTDTGGLSDTDTATVDITNVAPSVDPPVVTPEPSDEGESVGVGADFTDPGTPDTHTCTIDWGDGTVEAGTVGSGACSGTHTYADNATYSVEVCVTDDDSDQGCADGEHVVENVPPSVDPPVVSPEPSDEGSEASASADFTDPGSADTHTCTIDWGEGTVEAGTVADGACSGAHTYGDNGTFNVEICVTDNDDGTGCADSDHVVANVPPDVELDTSGAITFPGGDDAFLGRQDVEQSHDAEAEDPGSDDLTFDWDFGFAGSEVSTTYFNDSGDPFGTPDPLPSPHGTFPFSASDAASVTFADPGVFQVRVDCTDDDDGTDFEDLPKLVTGDGECAYSQGFWRHQFSGKGHQHIDDLTLHAYLDLIDFASAVFSEEVAASTPAEAQAVFAPAGSKRAKANRQALAAWLNWASGGVAWNELIDTDGNLVPDTPFSILIAMVEAILLDPDATHHELVFAKDLAEAVNLLDAENPDCKGPPETLPPVRLD